MNEVMIDLDAVKSYMTDKGFSEYSMAREMNVSYSYVYRVMRGQKPAGQSFVNGLLRIGMKPGKIFLQSPLPKGNGDGNLS